MKQFFILILSVLIFACTEHHDQHSVPKIHTRSQNIKDVANIYRDKDTKSAYLNIDTEKRWELYSGLTIESIDTNSPLLCGKGSGDFQLDVSTSVRSYFLLKIENKSTILAEKHLPMAGGYNFRDMGGFKTTDGSTVKWGKLFRSDEMNLLTGPDLDYLSSIPLISVVDFRSEDEANSAPDRIPSSVLHTYLYTINPSTLDGIDSLFYLPESYLDSLMTEMSLSFIREQEGIDSYKNFFSLLQNEENIPLIFHCTAGKDRTGIAAALVLYALGVDEDTIMEDYLASNIYLADKYGDRLSQFPNALPLLGVKYEFLQAVIQQIKTDYGTVENYLEEALEVDIELFRALYLD